MSEEGKTPPPPPPPPTRLIKGSKEVPKPTPIKPPSPKKSK